MQELLQKWAHMDTQLKQANEKIRKYREYKQDLSNQIFKHVNDARNKHQTPTPTPTPGDVDDDDDEEAVDEFVPAMLTIQSTGGRIQVFERIEYASITFGYLEECLTEIIPEEEHVSYILDFIRDNRKIRRIPDMKQLQPPHATTAKHAKPTTSSPDMK